MPLINVLVNASLDDKITHNNMWEILFNLMYKMLCYSVIRFKPFTKLLGKATTRLVGVPQSFGGFFFFFFRIRETETEVTHEKFLRSTDFS
jgi:hypothetical protein